MNRLRQTVLFFLVLMGCAAVAQEIPETFKNPILPGFNPDPSICRVGDDYYLVTSSFTWFPGLPIYHSKDLVNWEKIGHALNQPDWIDMNGLDDNDGIWAPTIRFHDGLFYIITTANKSGGNFFITAADPRGPWSEPVWIRETTGIDPSLFWDDDGRSYYIGNTWDFKKSWSSQCAVWIQEIDLAQGKLIGERKILTYGHANNATYAEGPHIYKINGKYLLLMAEGGSSYYHAVTAHHSQSLWGPYVADRVNPVLTHRHLGKDYPIQNLGHADLVQTPNGTWYSVALGVRNVDGYAPLARETFLCWVKFEDGSLIYNPGHGIVLQEQERPDLPWTPVEQDPDRDDFDSDELAPLWYFVRVPKQHFCTLKKGNLSLSLQPEIIDDPVNSAMIIRRTRSHRFTAMTQLEFQTKSDHEQAGIVFYRTANGYYTLMKGKDSLVLTRKHLGEKEIVATAAYQASGVCLGIDVDGSTVKFSFGEYLDRMVAIGEAQRIDAISDNKFNQFNGPGVGMYATSQGKTSKNTASFHWFEYRNRN